MAFDEKRITELMTALDISREEAIEVLQDDEDIDHDKPKDFDLSQEQLKVVAEQNRKVSHKKTESKTKRERKPNKQKRAVIEALFEFLSEKTDLNLENVTISNAEKMILFDFGEEKYSLDLVQKRKPKK